MQYDRYEKSCAIFHQILSANLQFPSEKSQISTADFDRRISITIVLKHVSCIGNFPPGNFRRQMRYDRYEKSCAIFHQILSANLQIPSENSQILLANRCNHREFYPYWPNGVLFSFAMPLTLNLLNKRFSVPNRYFTTSEEPPTVAIFLPSAATFHRFSLISRH